LAQRDGGSLAGSKRQGAFRLTVGQVLPRGRDSAGLYFQVDRDRDAVAVHLSEESV
jgi:hypothetical protein